MGNYIILELIPEAISPDKGSIVQLSALKLNDLTLIDRFDYRLNEDKVNNISVLDICNYDKDNFKYVNSSYEILYEFKKWSQGFKLLIIDNIYTNNFLNDLENEKESIFKYLNMEYHDYVIDDIINKYSLRPTNYIVDLLYEALIYESNNK
jgi:DNA polymerase III alpha subunit (gram-positive type)